MAANRVSRRSNGKVRSPSRGLCASGITGKDAQRRQARVTVKYNRKELQKRLDVEKWIDQGLEDLYRGREALIPEEVNIDELLDLNTDLERRQRLQEILSSCSDNTEVFTSELLVKLQGLQTQEDLHNDGIDLPQLHIYPSRPGSADREELH